MHPSFSAGNGGKGNIGKLMKALKPYSFMIAVAFLTTAISVVVAVIAPQWLSKLTD